MTSPGTGRPPGPGPEAVPAREQIRPEQGRPERGRPEQGRPEQSREDTDAGWGEYPEQADDRLYRDRPPHWDNF